MTNKYIEIIKELNRTHIAISDLMIWQEIYDNTDAHNYTNEQINILYNTVERAYMKAEYPLDLTRLVDYCTQNINKIYDMSIYEILMEVSR